MTSAAAIAAGYRACRRCKPDTDSTQQQHLSLIQRACLLLEKAEVPPSLERIASDVGLSRFYFHRLFKRYVGITPKEYSAMCQLRRLETLLQRGAPIIDAIYDAGFSSTSRIYEKTGRELGMTPAKFKSGASGLHISHAVVESPLGKLLVAMTEKGVCMLEFGGSSSELLEKLMTRFPGAKLVDSHPELMTALPGIIHLLGAPQSSTGLPLSLRGTAFQRKIRKALQRIPRGPAVVPRQSWTSHEPLPRHACAEPQLCNASPFSHGASHDDRCPQ